MTVFGWVNQLCAEPGTQAYSAWAHPLWLGWNEYPAKAGGVNRHIAWYTSPYPWSRSVRWCLAGRLACIGKCRRTGSGSTLEALCNDTHLFYFILTFRDFVMYCLRDHFSRHYVSLMLILSWLWCILLSVLLKTLTLAFYWHCWLCHQMIIPLIVAF